MNGEYLSPFAGQRDERPRRRPRNERGEPGEGAGGKDHIFLWTVFLLLLTGFCLATWIGTFTVFGHPERPFSYKVLRRIKKLDPPQRYKLNAAPQGEFLNAEKAYARFAALSDFDVRHIFIMNYAWDVPVFKDQHNLAGKVLGGWQISGITQFQTGTPSSVAVGTDYVGVGQDGSMSNGGQFWNMNGDPAVVRGFAANGNNDPNFWFKTTNSDGSNIFTQPAKGTFVSQKGIRNPIHNPGFENFNVGLFKKFAINDRTGFQFRAEAYNTFNHTNFNAVDTTIQYNAAGVNTRSSSANITSARDPRIMQFALRLEF
jgi:hypothetical protein